MALAKTAKQKLISQNVHRREKICEQHFPTIPQKTTIVYFLNNNFQVQHFMLDYIKFFNITIDFPEWKFQVLYRNKL